MYLYLINLLSIIWRTVTCIIIFVSFGRIMQYHCYLCQGNCVTCMYCKLVVCIDKFQEVVVFYCSTQQCQKVFTMCIFRISISFLKGYVIMYGLQCVTYVIFAHDVQTSSWCASPGLFITHKEGGCVILY